MTPEAVRAIVEGEIAGQWSRTNAHGCDLSHCLVNPTRLRYVDPTPSRQDMLELWLVLEERPVEGNGYKIVFDEARRDFGLACPGVDGRDVFLGWYGSFWETFEAM